MAGPFNWIVTQIGARQHYGVPRGFYYTNNLRVLYTEAWCRFGRNLLRRGPKSARAFATRFHPDLPADRVVSFNWRTFWNTATARRPRSVEEQFTQFAQIGQQFASRVADDLRDQQFDPSRDAYFGFNTGCLETMELLNRRGVLCIVDQIDPGKVEEDMVMAEAERWPGWQAVPGRIPQMYWDRLKAEWEVATTILVNSDWSKKALVQQGVPEDKMFVVPVAYEAEKTHVPSRNNLNRPVTVLWIGSVILRKGIQYLIEAAKLVQSNPNIHFLIAGPVMISEQAVASAPPNMRFVGRVTRDQTEGMYRQADIFVLPTISDGFAITQVEAMAQALPVIATPNCGEVVSQGVDGLIVPAYDGPALAEAILKLEADRELLREMSYKALDKSAQFYLPRQAQLVEEAAQRYHAHRGPAPQSAQGSDIGLRAIKC